MKIAIVHFGFMYSGGGERVAIKEAMHLRKRGHQVEVFSPMIRWDRCFPELLRLVKPRRIIPPFPLPFPFREASALIASASVPVFLRPLKNFDVLLCHSQPSMWIGFMVSKLYGLPYVGYLHQLTTFIHRRPEAAGNWTTKADFLLMDGLLGVFGRALARHLDHLCHVSASKLLFNSKYTTQCFQRAYGVEGDVCYPASDLNPHQIDASLLRARGHNACPTLITSGRHYPWKRIDLAIRLLSFLPDKPRLIVTGEYTSHTPALRRVTEDLKVADRVTFTGFTSDETLTRLYSMSDVYVQTSIQEPFGLSPLEAQSFGVPAVVWGDGGVRETVLDGRTGFHAQPYDLHDFARKVSLILDNGEIHESMSHEAQEWSSRFTWERHTDTVERALCAAC